MKVNKPKVKVNRLILRSLPLNRKMKRYWQSKYERIAANCGIEEAIRKFKQLYVSLLQYRSDTDRKSNLESYLSSTGFRKNGMLRMLFEYMETQPHWTLDLVKMYTAPNKSEKTIDQAAGETKVRLESVRANPSIPVYLICWLFNLTNRHGMTYRNALTNVNDPFHSLALNLGSFESWHEYWGKWYSLMRRGWKSKGKLDSKPVFPEVYKDYNARELVGSATYEADFADLISMHYNPNSPLSEDLLEFVDGYLNPSVGDDLRSVLGGYETSYTDVFRNTSILSGHYVGHVQHIHKKGGGTDYRDIAVPNRFIQAALVPGARRLYTVVRQLPKDCTFNQARFDTLIQNRVNNSKLYQGSVDLSKATDNLPASWGWAIVDALISAFGLTAEQQLLLEIFGENDNSAEIAENKEEMISLELFKTISRANWEDEGYLLRWNVGQPLGSLPSFAMLSITHNIILEAMAAHKGYAHSPYFVLGDDVVITNKKLRSFYIRELTSRGIPLSLHKSYSGELSEFAGKIFVRNCVPFYVSDHSPITWNSLFDYQRVTGVRIPWEQLPMNIKRKVISLVSQELSGSFKQSVINSIAKDAYDLVLTVEVNGRGSHIYPVKDSAALVRRIASYIEALEADRSPIPEAVKHTGITIIGNGHPVILMNDRFANKDGYFERYRPIELPAWYKAKVRPCATDAALKAAAFAVSPRSEESE